MKRILLYIIILMTAFAASAKPIDDARRLFNSGDYEGAIALLKPIVKKTPTDAAANYLLGASYYNLGDYDSAAGPLAKAEDRGNAEAASLLAIMAIDDYRVDAAARHIDNWEKLLKKARKSIPDELTELRRRTVMTKNMLERVEKIEIIDSIDVDSADFFNFYRLSGEAGKLLGSSVLPPQYSRQQPRVVYRPESGTELLWAMPGDDGDLQIVSAGILDDGTMQQPRVLDGLGDGGDADFPFLMPDGVTLYFANNGENSLGGYDIFLSRRDSDGSVLQPQNIGMPYNSPFDDYMLAIDESTGLGWWATNRNGVDGKVTIYTFIPNDSRVNYSSDDPDIAARALVSDIASTQVPGKDYDAYRRRLEQLGSDSASEAAPAFMLSMGDGRVYTSLDDFRNPQARKAMEEYLAAARELENMKAQLAALRRSYADGNSAAADRIISLEKRVLSAGPMLVKFRNKAIRLER